VLFSISHCQSLLFSFSLTPRQLISTLFPYTTLFRSHYLLTQITDILMQLFEKGSKTLKSFKKTIKEISSNLLEAIRTRILTDEDITHLDKPIQIRFT